VSGAAAGRGPLALKVVPAQSAALLVLHLTCAQVARPLRPIPTFAPGALAVSRKLWVVALAIWLVLWGLLAITNFRFEMQGFLMGVLAIASGVLLALDR
jgi:hypothetical protein